MAQDIDEIDDPAELEKVLEEFKFDDEPKEEGETPASEDTDSELDSDNTGDTDTGGDEPTGTEGPGKSDEEPTGEVAGKKELEPVVDPEKDHRVPVNLYTDTRKEKDEAVRRADELQRQLDDSNRELEEARKASKSTEGEGDLTDEKKEELRDELGESAANLIISNHERAIAAEARSAKLEAEIAGQQGEAKFLASLVGHADQLKGWFEGMDNPDPEIAKEMDRRIQMAAKFDPIAEELYPDDKNKQNAYIEKQVINALDLKETAPGKTEKPDVETPAKAEPSPTIGDMSGGAPTDDNSDEAFITRFQTMDPDLITQDQIDRANRIMANEAFG